MKRLLLNPQATFAIVITACAFIDTVCAGIMTSITPLEHVQGLGSIAPTISTSCVVLGVVSNVALTLAGIGRSFVSAIDNLKNSAGDGGLATGAAQAPSTTTKEDVAKS